MLNIILVELKLSKVALNLLHGEKHTHSLYFVYSFDPSVVCAGQGDAGAAALSSIEPSFGHYVHTIGQ